MPDTAFYLWDKLGSGALDEIRLASQAIWDIDDVKWNFLKAIKITMARKLTHRKWHLMAC